MKLICTIRGHRAAAGEIYNGGYHFSRCERCGEDMIRSGRSWKTVPQGHRVVWKSGPAWHSLEPDLSAHLPVLRREGQVDRSPSARLRRPGGTLALAGPGAAELGDGYDEAVPPATLFCVALATGLHLLFALRPR
jgi:hypothetical protein